MIRLIFWIAIVFAVLWVWRKIKSATQQPGRKSAEQTLMMVRCARCGVHLPQDRALTRGQHWYCSQVHLEEGPAPRER